ncbi:unnamed protein product [Lepeophtheirus salmonis]|uniref:(salmon louse) hypothetical protein n=1 Tax=Lepeophtheirus salmonis TaxID=72036 RepID=A0A7R8CJL7_LEPSM|nr:unnamed protein product [Lepeophtheirus salmonis]CAF2842302.1 unnamed protein product [Lepeophtheirus salmonis]
MKHWGKYSKFEKDNKRSSGQKKGKYNGKYPLLLDIRLFQQIRLILECLAGQQTKPIRTSKPTSSFDPPTARLAFIHVDMIGSFTFIQKDGLLARMLKEEEHWIKALPGGVWELRNSVTRDEKYKYSPSHLLIGHMRSLVSGFLDLFPIHKPDNDVGGFFETMESRFLMSNP